MQKRMLKGKKEDIPSIVVADKEACKAVAQYLQEYLVKMPLYKLESLK